MPPKETTNTGTYMSRSLNQTFLITCVRHNNAIYNKIAEHNNTTRYFTWRRLMKTNRFRFTWKMWFLVVYILTNVGLCCGYHLWLTLNQHIPFIVPSTTTAHTYTYSLYKYIWQLHTTGVPMLSLSIAYTCILTPEESFPFNFNKSYLHTSHSHLHLRRWNDVRRDACWAPPFIRCFNKRS